VGTSPAIRRVKDLIDRVAPLPGTVVIQGETGTGKELIARNLHAHSRRRGDFVPVNCGAIAPDLLESELFGHVRGAFTGAEAPRPGHFELADGGTLFLDEVSELPPDAQPKLLQLLQSRTYYPLGSDKPLRADVRVVAATNANLADAVAEGRFRSDLFYRLNVFPIRVPPLRDRREDIPALMNHFIGRFSVRMKKPLTRVSRRTMELLMSYRWPGNVRELENVLERALVLTDGPKVSVQDLPTQVRNPSPIGITATDEADLSVKRRLAELERLLIQRALERTSGNKTQAAELLELSPRALRYKIQDYGLA